MSNSSAAYRPARRSTRVEHAVPLRVEGVDSFRGPYKEDVSTVAISCHGFKYLSKHQVLTNALVVLELKPSKPNSPPISARGRVKWVDRPQDPNGVFQTAVELETPGNIWGIDSPPQDWLPFTGARTLEMDTSKPKPFAVPRPEVSASAAGDKRGTGSARPSEVTLPAASGARPVGQLMGDFQQQMEGMLAEAAASAVRDRAGTMLAELRASLREEAKQVLSEASASQAGPWIEQSIKQLNKASQESARILYGQWKKKLETDVQQALERVDQRGRELEESSQSLAMKAAERVQGVLESSRKEGVGRIVARLKEQMAPSIDNALKVTSDLAKHKNELEKTVERSIEKSTERIEEIYARCEKKFESAIQEKLDAAREELEAQSKEATQLALSNLRASGQKYSAEAERHFREAFQPIVDKALSSLKEKAAETSHHFASELASYSRSHLEFVGGAISELAKGMGKAPREK